MKISLNWLRKYLTINHSDEKIAQMLTDTGLEVEGIETFESVKGGLEGIVIGEIKSVLSHPNADRLQLTKVDVGHAELLSIVCGAPNVAEGQKVVVALVGTTLYPDEKGFKIKKSKIRGELSEGMLCAEDEIGLGESHDGIMVLDRKAKVGTPASEYFETKRDTVFEIGLTPNRVDAASHYGVARDLAALLNLSEEVTLEKPSVDHFSVDKESLNIKLEIKENNLCPRYSGLVIDQLKVGESPDWLKNSLKAVGIKPINNVVDVTNFVLHETGQPLHAFDYYKVKGKKVVVKCLNPAPTFVTLDGEERKLSNEDLMICNESEPMCIAGVFGGKSSGVNEQTTAIFLESAFFDAVSIRKTAKRHGLNTDASFRYERGADPNITVYALKRAALLLKEVAGGVVSSSILDEYPSPIEDHLVELNFDYLNRICGQFIRPELVKTILEHLEIKIIHQSKSQLRLSVPAYRVDVKREIDVVEEILRIYGYNNIKLPTQMRSSLSFRPKLKMVKIRNKVADFLSHNSCSEILNNSLTNSKYYEKEGDLIKMLNPLSKETEVLRKSLLFGGLETIAYNQNRKRKNLKFFEFGKIYQLGNRSEFIESEELGIWFSGEEGIENWQKKPTEVNFYSLKGVVENLLLLLGINEYQFVELEGEEKKKNSFSSGLKVLKNKKELLSFGRVTEKVLKQWDISELVYFAQLNWSTITSVIDPERHQYEPVSKFPSIRRDLALLIDESVKFSDLSLLAKRAEKRLLKEVNLFDVYDGKNLPAGKKSYGMSFVFQDHKKTLTDQQVDQIMKRLINSYGKEFKAELR